MSGLHQNKLKLILLIVKLETLRRVETVLYGPHSGAFCQIMDILMNGYGKLNIDSDLLSVRFLYEEKVKF